MIFEPVLSPKIFLVDVCLNFASVTFLLHVLELDHLAVKHYWLKNNCNSILLYLISTLFIIILIIMVEFLQCYCGQSLCSVILIPQIWMQEVIVLTFLIQCCMTWITIKPFGIKFAIF